MTLKEILKSQGLTDEQVETVTGEMKQNKIFTAGEENLDIRYKDLQGKFDSKSKEHQEATALIEQLKKDNAGNEALQSKISAYESTISDLQKQLEQSKIDSALEVALLKANVLDVDYLAFKIREKGEVKLDENGKIKGIDDTIATLKTQYPTQFKAESGKKIEENKLPDGDSGKPQGITQEQFAKMGYMDRLKLHAEDPKAYEEFTKKE